MLIAFFDGKASLFSEGKLVTRLQKSFSATHFKPTSNPRACENGPVTSCDMKSNSNPITVSVMLLYLVVMSVGNRSCGCQKKKSGERLNPCVV